MTDRPRPQHGFLWAFALWDAQYYLPPAPHRLAARARHAASETTEHGPDTIPAYGARVKITDRFSAEHSVFLLQLETLESLTGSAASTEGIVAAVRTLALPLLTHAEDEELALFPALAPDLGADGGSLAALAAEHERIARQLEELTGYPTRPQLEATLAAFAALLREHIAKEENALFPVAVRLLGDARLAELDAAKPPASSAPTRS